MARLNKNPLAEIPFTDFGGGYAGAKGSLSLDPNEAQDLDNIIVLPKGAGIRPRQGNKEYQAFTGSSAPIGPITALGTFKNATSEYMVWAASDYPSQTETLVFTTDLNTSANATLRYTSATANTQNAIFTTFNFMNLMIGVGAHLIPWKIDFSGGTPAGAVLGGSPPNGTVGLSWNNVAWIGNIAGDNSKLFYSVLEDAEDWSSAGSGFVRPNPNDGDELVALAPVSTNILLYFKHRSIYQVVGRADPFAVYPLFQGVGCAGKNACVTIDGLVYFITPQGRMLVTDGNFVYNSNQTVKYSYAKDMPQLDFADDLWDTIPQDRIQYVYGFREQGETYDHLIWMVSSGVGQTTNNFAIVWDLKNKCWLKHSKGFNGNVAAQTSTGLYYIGGYTFGRWYQLDFDGKYDDDSEGTPQTDGNHKQVVPPLNPGSIQWYWRTDDISLNSLENIVQVDRINVAIEFKATGSFNMSYGYDGFHDQNTTPFTVVPATFILGIAVLGVDILGGLKFTTKSLRPLGRGNSFNFKVGGVATVAAQVTKFTFSGRQAATKVSDVR